ncbi:heavy-metal-associated domain-containing protein [Panacibacter ginsenosidivorans]|uniref:Heavy-metal-associated domain-containing protein n=1 Tax=Panacibacter ginsenosidivorans TaxID=1813871 RepID=A0A5B8VEF6_9BACT|nr:heavy-metal-associated domain-containing protein [Panacibacter ginsenosidivorans]QEC69907.1 heavy-metal-associated domain-containing protein [Panacibacter ginsenosidivorans]
MKKLVTAFVLLIASLITNAQITKAKLVASGLTCSMCSKAIYEALQKVNTIENVKANIKESSYNIVFKKDVTVSPDDVKKAVEDAGFSVAKLQVTVSFDNVEIKNDGHVKVGGINLHFLNVQPQTLNGEKVLTVLDKNFESAKDFKKYAGYTTMKCFATGVMESCCSDSGKAGERIYHVTI